MVLQCNDFRNIPHIHVHEKRENKERWHGAEIQIVIEGNWTTYRVRFRKLVLTGGSIYYELHRFLLFMDFLCLCSPKYCITCVKWLSLHRMRNFFSCFCRNLQSTSSLPLYIFPKPLSSFITITPC